ncbi:hypothetical protein AXF42_Ash017064 [Apostasia shenzhenica]|uniref:Uncharacterized protein n=1 Tax=Apostasia shenzhenica TaxID=1088818 RepID=A0A2I0B7M1_9ASPA|nr:hypothetical protein AXF42_Ash017064 [Apostasia shenzhenica]
MQFRPSLFPEKRPTPQPSLGPRRSPLVGALADESPPSRRTPPGSCRPLRPTAIFAFLSCPRRPFVLQRVRRRHPHPLSADLRLSPATPQSLRAASSLQPCRARDHLLPSSPARRFLLHRTPPPLNFFFDHDSSRPPVQSTSFDAAATCEIRRQHCSSISPASQDPGSGCYAVH